MNNINLGSFAVKNNNLLELILRDNNISKLNINIFVNLTILCLIDLSDNSIKIISRSLFKYNTNLECIYLHNNKLIYFNFNLDTLQILYDLTLNDNKLTTLNSKHFLHYLNNDSAIYISKDRYINIAGNRFSCNSNMNWISVLRNRSYIQIGLNTTYCHTLVDDYNVTLSCFLRIKPNIYPAFESINC